MKHMKIQSSADVSAACVGDGEIVNIEDVPALVAECIVVDRRRIARVFRTASTKELAEVAKCGKLQMQIAARHEARAQLLEELAALLEKST